MAAPRYLPVDERALRAVVTALEGITTDNGYNTTVRHVRRVRVVAAIEDISDPPEIHLLFEQGQSRPRGTSEIWYELPISLFFYARTPTDEPDTEYRLFKCDIVRAMTQGLVDASGVKPADIKVDWEMTDRPLYYGEPSGWTAGEVQTRILVSWCMSDPRRWSAADELVVDE